MTRHRRRAAARPLVVLATGASALAVCAILLSGHSAGALTAALYLLPPSALFFALALGRYPGERVLSRLGEEPAPRRPRPVSSRRPCEHPAELLRGGRLIAVSRAGRAPPLAWARC